MRTATLTLTATVLILAVAMAARKLIQEIPFDVAVWGDIDTPPIDEERLKRIDEGREQARKGEQPEWFKQIRERATEIRKEDLGGGAETGR